MNIYDLVSEADLIRAREAGLISVRENEASTRCIFNYTKAAMYTPGAWDNPAVRICRGLIIDTTGEVIARPWEKFFNYGQAEAGEFDLEAPVEVTDKIDGSLGILYYDEDGLPCVATRGSFTSEQASHATKLLREMGIYWNPDFTPLVEIVYPENRIVCDYGDQDCLVLLGAVQVESGLYLTPNEADTQVFDHDWPAPDIADTFGYRTLRQALEAEPRPGAEGFVIHFVEDNRLVKVKQEDYVALHRIVTGLSERSVWEHMMAEKPLDELLANLPDELHPWTREVYYGLMLKQQEIIGDVTGIFHSIVDDTALTRAGFAEEAKKHGPLTPFLFQLWDEKKIELAVLKTLRPKGDTRAKTISEDIA